MSLFPGLPTRRVERNHHLPQRNLAISGVMTIPAKSQDIRRPVVAKKSAIQRSDLTITHQDKINVFAQAQCAEYPTERWAEPPEGIWA